MKKSKKFVLAALALLAAITMVLLPLAGCKNDSVPETPAAKLVSISVNPPTRTVYSVGQSFDPTGMVVTATYEGGEKREVTGWETDFNTVAGEKGLGKTVTVSYKEGETPKTTTFTVTVFPAEVKVLTGYTSPNNTDDSWTYVAFGEWPQGEAPGVNPTLVDPQPENLFKDKYYFDANGEYVEAGGKYYKVEPIVWRVLTEDYKDPDGNSTGNALLLAESILTGGIPYYVDTSTRAITGAGTVYPNNWQYSTIRAWLNGSYEANDPQDKTYTDKGFLQTAFTESARKLIAPTSVDNSAASTNPASNDKQWNDGKNKYASDTPTTDKIFLLSEEEATTSEYGFAEYNVYVGDNDGTTTSTGIRVTTDYANATGADQSSTEDYGSWWWLRSPYHALDVNIARVICNYGYAITICYANDSDGGVVPALSISLQSNLSLEGN